MKVLDCNGFFYTCVFSISILLLSRSIFSLWCTCALFHSIGCYSPPGYYDLRFIELHLPLPLPSLLTSSFVRVPVFLCLSSSLDSTLLVFPSLTLRVLNQ